MFEADSYFSLAADDEDEDFFAEFDTDLDNPHDSSQKHQPTSPPLQDQARQASSHSEGASMDTDRKMDVDGTVKGLYVNVGSRFPNDFSSSLTRKTSTH